MPNVIEILPLSQDSVQNHSGWICCPNELTNPNEYEGVVKLKINRRDSWMGASPSSGGEQAGCQRVAALPPQQGDGACGLHCIFHPLMRITTITLVQSKAG